MISQWQSFLRIHQFKKKTKHVCIRCHYCKFWLICAKSHTGWMLGYKYFYSGLRWPDATYTVNIPTCGVICFPLFKLFWRLYNSEKKTGGGFVGPECLYLCEHIPWPLRPGLITEECLSPTPIHQWYNRHWVTCDLQLQARRERSD